MRLEVLAIARGEPRRGRAPDTLARLQEMAEMMAGARLWLRRALGNEGEVLDRPCSERPHRAAGVNLMRELLKKQGGSSGANSARLTLSQEVRWEAMMLWGPTPARPVPVAHERLNGGCLPDCDYAFRYRRPGVPHYRSRRERSPFRWRRRTPEFFLPFDAKITMKGLRSPHPDLSVNSMSTYIFLNG
jgi:hypothetical protein